jgi:hypothetical protein
VESADTSVAAALLASIVVRDPAKLF